MKKILFNRRGFTLIELLVVLSIIFIFAALLLPVLANAKAYSKRIICINNLKQIGIASYNYETDNGRMIDTSEWLYPYDSNDLTKGLIFNYIKSKQIFLCPNELNKQFVNHSYLINCNSANIKNINQALNSSETIFFLERTNLPSINWYAMTAFKPVFHHNNKTVILKMDCHIDILNENYFDIFSLNNYFWRPDNPIIIGSN